MRQDTSSATCLGTCLFFPSQSSGEDAGGSHGQDGWAVQCGADLLCSQTQLMAQEADD